MLGIQLENALGTGHLRTVHGLHDLFHLHAHIVLVRDEAAGTVSEAAGHTNVLDLLLQFLLQESDQFDKFFVGLFLFLLDLLAVVQFDIAFGNRLPRLLRVGGQALRDPLVDGICQEENFDAMGFKLLQQW